MKQAIVAALVTSASAFPWVVDVPGVDSSMLGSRHHRRQQVGEGAGGPASCPYNADHKPAAPYDARWPYAGAKNGAPGTGKGGYLVPAPDDAAHQYVAPGKNDIRGPCPGLNTAANHNFLAHDGITTYTELVDAQQNVYNVGYDLANLLATLGLTLTDGDIVTQKLSIGCDATTRTSFNPILTGSEPGLDGHNKFEADASLTRNDFFTHGGDNFSFNRTLFDMMTQTTGGYFNREGLSKYRLQRYEQSRAENPNFFFGPLTLLLYGAASFLYELMPSGTNGYQPDYATIESFFVHERIPDNWTTRITPYSNMDVTNQIVTMYLENPVLFGGNTADGSFNAINFGAIKDGKIEAGISAKDTSCLLYQLATGQVPGYLNGLITPTVEALSFVATKLGPEFANLGCPIPLT